MTEQGVPLGLIDAQCWPRDPGEFGKKALRGTTPIEDKESWRWIKGYQALEVVQKRNPHIQLVSVGDREADIYELFEEALREPGSAKLLVRARHDRKVQDEQQRLFDTIRAQPVAGYQPVHLPRQSNRPSREAQLAIRFASATLCPPKAKPGLPRLEVRVVFAQEVNAPNGAEPIEWWLLTTAAADNFEQACEKVAWYSRRWGIEVFHRILKSGCNIEDRQLGQGERLQACLAIDMVIAWRIHHLTTLGREVPDLPADVYFEKDEIDVLVAYDIHHRDRPREAPAPSLGEAIRMIAKHGGFLGRKGDGEPGTETLWRGLLRLDGLTQGWRLPRGP
jgi:hypothetical protein